MLVACSLDEIGINERIPVFRKYLNSDKSWQKDSRKEELLSHLQVYPSSLSSFSSTACRSTWKAKWSTLCPFFPRGNLNLKKISGNKMTDRGKD